MSRDTSVAAENQASTVRFFHLCSLCGSHEALFWMSLRWRTQSISFVGASLQDINAFVWVALVTNAAVYVVQHITRIVFTLIGSAIAYRWPENGPNWFISYGLGMVFICVLLLIWTAALPHQSSSGRRSSHLAVTCMAALNLGIAIGTVGLLATMSAKNFADTPENHRIRSAVRSSVPSAEARRE